MNRQPSFQYPAASVAILFILLFCGPSRLVAQDNRPVQLHTRQGDKLSGMLLPQPDSQKVRLKLGSGQELDFDRSDIVWSSQKGLGKPDWKRMGYFLAADLGFMVGNPPPGSNDYYYYYNPPVNMNNQLNLSLQVLNGFRVNRFAQFALSFGLNVYTDAGVMPFMLHYRAEALKGPFTPFLELAGGLSVPVFMGDKIKGTFGPCSQVGIGVKLSSRRGPSSATMSIGYRFEEFSLVTPREWPPNSQVETKYSLQRFYLRFGYHFLHPCYTKPKRQATPQ